MQVTFGWPTGSHAHASTVRAVDGSVVAAAQQVTGVAAVSLELDRSTRSMTASTFHPGYQVLKATAESQAVRVKGGEAVGRIGGDEFAIACSGVGMHPPMH